MRSTRRLAGQEAASIAKQFSKKDIHVTQLSNGLRVITKDDGTGMTGVGFFNACAPSNETAGCYGSSAVMESLPLCGNQYHTAQDISAFFERSGNSFKVINQKEILGYMAMVPRYHTEDALELLTGMVLYPSTDAQIFDHCKANLAYAAEVMSRDATRVCFEQVYTAGWGHQGVGVPQIPEPEEVEKLTFDTFQTFHKTFTRPETSVVAGIGVRDHADFVEKVRKIVRFDCTDDKPVIPLAEFRGGCIMKQNLEAPESTSKFAEKNLTHIAMCMPTNSMRDDDYYTYSVLQTLMGGGTSFSSGGPGKGLQTKLFQEVINREGWIHGIESITGWFQCGGLVGLYGQCPHEWNGHLHRTMLYQLASMSQRVTPQQLEMAKNQLMSQLVLLGEGREIILEEMGKNLLLHNHITCSEELLAGTQRVTLESLHQGCRKAIVGKKMALSVFGNTQRLPDLETTEHQLQNLFKKLNP